MLTVHRLQFVGLNVARSGIAAAIPPFLCIVAKCGAGAASDRLPGLSARARVVVFAAISQVKLVARVEKKNTDQKCLIFRVQRKIGI